MLEQGKDHEHIKRTSATVVLDVEVETINNYVSERTRISSLYPLLIYRAEGIPKEIGEAVGSRCSTDVLSVRRSTTQGQENLLSGSLAACDIRCELRALRQELCWFAVNGIRSTSTLISEIGTRITIKALFGEGVDETDINNIQ